MQSYTVSNAGNVPLCNVSLSDAEVSAALGVTPLPAVLVAGDANNNSVLDVGETWVYEVAGVAGADGAFNNTGVVDAQWCGYPDVAVNASDPSSYYGSAPRVTVDKVAGDGPAGPYVDGDALVVLPGNGVVFSYNVTNAGNTPLSGVVVSDDNGTPANATDDFVLAVGDLAPGESKLVTSASIPAGSALYINTATASGTPPGGLANVSATDPSGYTPALPSLTIDKKTNDKQQGGDVLRGSNVTWTYTVVNTGNVRLENIVVHDDAGTPGTASSDDWVVGTIAALEPGANATLSWTGTADTQGNYTNLGEARTTYTDALNNTVTVTTNDTSTYYGATPAITITTLTNGQDGAYILNGTNITWVSGWRAAQRSAAGSSVGCAGWVNTWRDGTGGCSYCP